jgi:hypothetical protein
MEKIKHLSEKFSIARYELIIACEPQELQFYLYLKLYAINNHSAFPGQETIFEDLGWDKDKVSYWVKKMVEKGHLKYKAGKGRISSLYDITWYDNFNMFGRNDRGENSGGRGGKIPASEGGKLLPERLVNITNNNITNNSEFTPKGEMEEFIKPESKFFEEIIVKISEHYKIDQNVLRVELNKFKSYWVEKNKSGRKMKWELQQTFELRRRIATWLNNAIKFNKAGKSDGLPKMIKL